MEGTYHYDLKRECIIECLIDCPLEWCPPPVNKLEYPVPPILPDDQVFFVRRTLGRGSFGDILLVRGQYSETLYALKRMRKKRSYEDSEMRHVWSEKNIWSTLHHPNIISLFRTYQDANHLYFLMEAILGGNLYTLLENHFPLSKLVRQVITANLVRVLTYLHAANIVHRDLKTENIIFASSGQLKVCDFGLAKKLETTKGRTYSFCGTVPCMAPETILNKGHGTAVDCWALGVLLYEISCRANPFNNKNSIVNVEWHRPTTTTIMEVEAVAFCEAMLHYEPEDRLGAFGTMREVENHTWFDGLDFSCLQAYDSHLEALLSLSDGANKSCDIVDWDEGTEIIFSTAAAAGATGKVEVEDRRWVDF